MTAFVYDLIYTVPMCVASVIMAGSFFDAGSDRPVLTVAIISAFICVLFGHLKVRGRLLIGGIAAALTVGTWFVDKGETLQNNLYVAGILLAAALCFVLHRISIRYKKIKTGLALIYVILLVFSMVRGGGINRLSFGMLFFCILIFAVETVQSAWKKEGDTDTREHIVYILPFVVLLFIPLFVFTIPDEPYDWKFVKELAANVREGYEILMQAIAPEDGWDGGDGMGFSERAFLGGSVQNDPYRVLSVSSDLRNDYRLYLGGKSFDTFDGRRWTKTDESEKDCRTPDVLETMAALMHRGEDYAYFNTERVRIHIKYEGVRTGCVFTPSKSSPNASVDVVQKGGDLKFKRGKRGDYTVSYYRINRDAPGFIDIMKKEEVPDENDWELAVQNTRDALKTQYSYEDYKKYREDIYTYYLQPVELSDGARKLTDELLAGAGSDYEKLERIEKLLQGFEYSTDPGDIPETVKSSGDYIDYFLFEKKKGFCTHFATAFVLLARSQNIPARYVQGYSVLSKATSFEVRSDRTHAWPEAYIDGVGWIGFEPTPGYKQAVGWTKVRSSKGGAAEDYYKDYIDNANAQDEKDEAADKNEEDKGVVSFGFRSVIISVIFVLMFVAVFLTVDRLYRKYRYQHMDDKDKVRYLCMRNMKQLRLIGIALVSGETLGEFGKRTAQTLPDNIRVFIEIYERVLYAPERSYNDEVEVMEACRKDCGIFVRKNLKFAVKKIIHQSDI